MNDIKESIRNLERSILWTDGICALLAAAGTLATGFMLVKRWKGAVLGTSTTSSYVESASGVMVGGKTGLMAVTSAFLFALAVAAMPFTYSISDGIMFVVIAYTLINACAGNFKRIHWIMYVLTLVFAAKYALT